MAKLKGLQPDALIDDDVLSGRSATPAAVQAPVAQHARREHQATQAYIRELESKLQDAELRIEQSGDEEHILADLDPQTIRRSRLGNRIELSFRDTDFQELVQRIAHTNGNEVPICVRPIDDPEHDWEIVYGQRRHAACLELGLPVTARIKRDVSDRELIQQMMLENHDRSDLAPYEEGLMFVQWINEGLVANQSQVGELCGLTKAYVSERITVARLDPSVTKALGDPRHLGVEDARRLNRALHEAPDAVWKRVAELVDESTENNYQEVDRDEVRRRVGYLINGTRRSPRPPEIVKGKSGRPLFRVRRDKGRTAITLERGVPASIGDGALEQLRRYLDAELERHKD